MSANITKDEWLNVYNSNNELEELVKSLQSQISDLEERVRILEQPLNFVGNEEVKVRE